jgi:hypothetical protein
MMPLKKAMLPTALFIAALASSNGAPDEGRDDRGRVERVRCATAGLYSPCAVGERSPHRIGTRPHR